MMRKNIILPIPRLELMKKVLLSPKEFLLDIVVILLKGQVI